MSLKDIEFQYTYRSSSDQMVDDFYIPCLRESDEYDRAVGYFTSDSLSLLSEGLEPFVNSDGKIRIIANPNLREEDIEAIKKGYKSREEVLFSTLEREVENINYEDNISALTYLIYKGKLDIKIAYPTTGGIYHEKFGIFKDSENNMVGFSGSANETVGGLRNNFETIAVFSKDYEQIRVQEMVTDFEKLWNDSTSKLKIIPIPEFIINKLYQKSPTAPKDYEKVVSKGVKLRQYQIDAITALEVNEWQGIFEMATGTGKTYTSLSAAKKFKSRNNRIFLIIMVPFKHLIEQWEKSARGLGFDNILKCSSDNNRWKNELRSITRDFKMGFKRDQVVITTYRTASSTFFNTEIKKIEEEGCLIADECHYFGQPNMRDSSYEHLKCKIGLSATPRRWFDEEGTEFIYNFFNDVVFEYTLEDAIRNNFLTEYEYTPVICDLNQEEILQFEEITKKILSLIYKEHKTKIDEDNLERWYRDRAKIIKKADSKKEMLFNILSKKDLKTSKHILVYCSEGESELVVSELNRIGFNVHQFTHTVPNNKRQDILKAFEVGEIQVLVAINCLDEGVDIPATREAYFLASTSNPRQFVQRRGRILRKSTGKSKAIIYDFIICPSDAKVSTTETILRKELPRVHEFSSGALNKYQSREVIMPLLSKMDESFTDILENGAKLE